jgi:hypothetical protein
MIESATADRRCCGSLVIRNTYQTVVTRRDLYHQHHVETRRAAREAARSRWPVWNLKMVGIAVH